MACGSQSPDLENDHRDAFYDIDACPTTPLSLLLKIRQPATAQSQPRPLPIGVMTDRSLIELIVKATGVTPMGVTIMNDVDAVVEFEKGAKVIEIAQTLHSIDTWTGYKVVVGCIVSTKPLLVETTREIEAYRRAERDFQKERRELKEEEQRSKLQIQDLLDKFEEQVKRVELLQSRTSVSPLPIDISTPQISIADLDKPGVSKQIQSIFAKMPPLPTFSGTIPVPKGEGSYEQFMFQIRGFKNSYPEEAMKNGIIGSVTDAARDYLDFIGFDKDLDIIIRALERRYGKGQTTDRIQQEFYQLSQERGETIQQFAGRIELKYKKLIELYPGRYTEEMLKERLFYGMTQHLRNSMRYLYKQPTTEYDELLQSAKEAESEWMDNKLRVRSTTTGAQPDSVDDPGKREREELKERLERLTESMKVANLQTQKRDVKKSSPRSPKSDSPRSTMPSSPRSRGPAVTSAGPFQGRRRPLQCYKCGGWGHVQRECPTSENVDWRGMQRADPAPEQTPGPESA